MYSGCGFIPLDYTFYSSTVAAAVADIFNSNIYIQRTSLAARAAGLTGLAGQVAGPAGPAGQRSSLDRTEFQLKALNHLAKFYMVLKSPNTDPSELLLHILQPLPA